MKKYYTTILSLVLAVTMATAQNRIAEKKGTKRRILGDTTQVYYYKIANPTERILVDTSLYSFEDLDLTWNNGQWFSDIGLVGTAAFDLVYQAKQKGGFRVGLNQFDRYRLQREDVKYYEVKFHRPYSDLYYSQINQKHNFVKADFGYRFNDNVYIGLQYDLIAQTGFYTNQHVRNQNVGFVFRGTTNDKKYHGYFNFITNTARNEDNGGVQQNLVEGQAVAFLMSIPVYSSTAETNYSRTEISYSQFLYNSKTDSAGAKTAATNELSHRIGYQFNRYKFFDQAPTVEMYGTDAYVNPRGLRVFIRHQVLENEIAYRQAIGGSLSKAPLWVRAYLRHQAHFVFQEPIKFTVHNITGGLVLQNNPQYKLKYRAEGQATWAERQLDFSVSGHLGYDMGQFGLLKAEGLFQRYQPSLIDRQLYISWDPIWNNNLNFAQVQEFNFGGSYAVKKWGQTLDIGVLNHTLTNWVYYDSLRVNQTNKVINVLQLKGQLNLKFWKMHLDNQAVWQPTLVGREYFRVPDLMLRSNLYFESYLFNYAMLAKIGVAFQYNTPFYANGYVPHTGAFYLQNREVVAMQPRLDAYLSFRIWQFRFFVRGENLLYFLNQQNYFTAFRRPIHNVVVRVGISWRLFD